LSDDPVRVGFEIAVETGLAAMAPWLERARREFAIGADGLVPHGRHHDFIVKAAAAAQSRSQFSEPVTAEIVRRIAARCLDDAPRHEREVLEATRSAHAKYAGTCGDDPTGVLRVCGVPVRDGTWLFHRPDDIAPNDPERDVQARAWESADGEGDLWDLLDTGEEFDADGEKWGEGDLLPLEDGWDEYTEVAEQEQDWHEDALLELARAVHVSPDGLSKAEIHARIRAALGTTTVEEVTYPDGSRDVYAGGELVASVETPGARDARTRGRVAFNRRMEIAREVYRLRATLYKAPGFIPLVDTRTALDGSQCGVPRTWVPAVDPKTWRTDRRSIAWNLAQRMGEAAYWFSWPVLRYVYVAERLRDAPITSHTNLYIARSEALASVRQFAEDVAAHLERVGAARFLQLYAGPDRDVAVVVTDVPPDRMIRGSKISWSRSGRPVRPAADAGDAKRMLTETVGRALSHFPPDADSAFWARVAVVFSESRVHFLRPGGDVLDERVHREVHEIGSELCDGAFMHPGDPVPVLQPGRFVKLVKGVGPAEQFEAIRTMRIRELSDRMKALVPVPVPVDRGPPHL